MISAKQARISINSYGDFMQQATRPNRNARSPFRHSWELEKIVHASISTSAQQGLDSCISRTLDTRIIEMLKNHGFKVSKEVEEDDWFYVISWEKDNASKS